MPKPGLSSVVGAHDKFQPETWRQVHNEEEVEGLNASKPHATWPPAVSDSSVLSHPDLWEHLF